MADNSYEDLFSADVFDMHGTRIGPVGQVYLDDQTQMATWITVKTGLFGLKETFAPLSRAVVEHEKVTVPYDAQLVRDAPRVDPDKHLDAAEEAELYTHYGITNVMAVEPSLTDEPQAAPAAEPADEEIGSTTTVDTGTEAPSRAMPLDPAAFSAATSETETTSLPKATVAEDSISEPIVPSATEATGDSFSPTTDPLLPEPTGTDSLIDESLEETVVVIPPTTDSTIGEPRAASVPTAESEVRNSTIEKLTRAIDEIEDTLADETAERAAIRDGNGLNDGTAEHLTESHDYYNEVKDK